MRKPKVNNSNNIGAVQSAVQSGFSPNEPVGLCRRSLLMPAVRSGDAEMVRKLLKLGADSKAKDLGGNSLLHLANNHLDILKIFFDPEIVENCVNNHRETPLSTAISSSHMKMAKYMIEHGVDAGAKLDNFYQNASTLRDLVSAKKLMQILKNTKMKAENPNEKKDLNSKTKENICLEQSNLDKPNGEPVLASSHGESPKNKSDSNTDQLDRNLSDVPGDTRATFGLHSNLEACGKVTIYEIKPQIEELISKLRSEYNLDEKIQNDERLRECLSGLQAPSRSSELKEGGRKLTTDEIYNCSKCWKMFKSNSNKEAHEVMQCDGERLGSTVKSIAQKRTGASCQKPCKSSDKRISKPKILSGMKRN